MSSGSAADELIRGVVWFIVFYFSLARRRGAVKDPANPTNPADEKVEEWSDFCAVRLLASVERGIGRDGKNGGVRF